MSKEQGETGEEDEEEGRGQNLEVPGEHGRWPRTGMLTVRCCGKRAKSQVGPVRLREESLGYDPRSA
jgi:hypothetical protein